MSNKNSENNIPYKGDIKKAIKAKDYKAIKIIRLYMKNNPNEGETKTIRKTKAKTKAKTKPKCMVCLDKFNSGNRKRVECPNCEKGCCVGCLRKCLLASSLSTPECPDCAHKFSLEFVADNTPKIFHNNQYRKKRAQDLLSQQRSLLPLTQQFIVDKAEQDRRANEINMLQTESYNIRRRLKEINAEVTLLASRTYGKKEKKVRNTFIMGCGVPECRGFLSQAWKCGTCGVHTCSKCRVVKIDGEDHECNDDDVATASLLTKETKPCPKCAVTIYKISGCDQIWCQHEDTLVWMWSGEKKKAVDVVSGDYLIGDDGTPRRVEEMTHGHADMYEVEQRFGDNYKVIGKHLLTLKHNGKIIDISTEDFIKLSPRAHTRGYYRVPGSVVLWKHQPVPIDPYILGMWLGDGTSRGDGFASKDPELIRVWVDWCIKNNLEVTHGRPFGYDIRNACQGKRVPVGYNSMKTCHGCKKDKTLTCASIEELDDILKKDPENQLVHELLIWRKSLPERCTSLIEGKARTPNRFKIMLDNCGVLNNKHVPTMYLKNNTQTRLECLAGLMDTDGNVHGNSFRFSQSIDRVHICNSVQSLAHSVGLATTKKEHIPGIVTFPCGKACNCKKQIKIRIVGNTSIIPTKLKKITNIGIYPNSTIKVSPAGCGRFVGWSVSGANSRYLLGDGTVTHNCTSCHTAFSWKTGKIVTGVIHNPHFYEWQRSQNGGVAPRPEGERYDCGGIPWIQTVEQIMTHRGTFFPKWAECHRSVAHVSRVVARRYPRQVGIQDHTDLRISYLLKDINEKEWVDILRRRQKKVEKDQEIHNILEMYSVTLTDIFQRFVRDELEIYNQAHVLREYVNDHLQKISVRYNNLVPQINEDWQEARWR